MNTQTKNPRRKKQTGKKHFQETKQVTKIDSEMTLNLKLYDTNFEITVLPVLKNLEKKVDNIAK